MAIIWDVPPIVAGTVLIVERIESQNYVPGSAGWAIEADGDAEFSDVTIRGDLITGTGPPDPHIEILRLPGDSIDFYTGDAAETAPGRLQVGMSGGSSQVDLHPPISAATGSPDARLRMFNDFAGGPDSSIELQARRLSMLFPNASLLFGDDGVSDPTIDNSGVNTPIHLGDTSGYESARMTPNGNTDNTNAVTNSTTYTGVTGGNTMTATLPYSPTGKMLIIIGASLANSIANTNTLTSFEIRDTNGAGTLRLAASDTRAILFQPPANNGAIHIGRAFLVTGLPTSGTMWIQMQHRVSANTGTFGFRNLVAVPVP